MFNKIKKIKDMRDKAKKMKEKMAEVTAEGSSGWGAKATVEVNGNQEVLSVDIDEKLMDDKEKLQEAVKDAVNDGMENVQKALTKKMKDMGDMQEMMKNFGL